MPGRILVQTIDGRWETLGTDRDPGNEPYGIAATYNEWGPDTLAFNIRRDPSLAHADLEAFAPMRYYADTGDRPVWAGFLLERPGSNEADPSIAGAARGWQYHLDDDLYRALLAHSDMGEWKDTRSFAANPTQLQTFVAGPTVNVDGGYPVLQWSKGAPVDPGTDIGITFDAGPDPACWPWGFDLVIEGINTSLTTNFRLYVRVHDTMDKFIGGQSPVTPDDYHDAVAATSGTVFGGTLDPAGTNGRRRYVTVILARDAAAGAVAASATDVGLRIVKLNLYGDTAYRSTVGTNHSTLKVSQIIKTALPFAPLLSPDTDGITDTSLEIGHAAWPREPLTPREVLERWNAYHRYVLKVGGDNLNKIVFRPQPARAVLRVDTNEPGARFADASTSSGADVYNRVIVTGRSGSGLDLTVERLSADLAARTPAVGLQPLNPSADTNVLNVTGATRDTTLFDSAPASFTRTDSGGPRSDQIIWAFPSGGLFRKGVSYVAELMIRVNAVAPLPFRFISLGRTARDDEALKEVTYTNTFALYTVTWTPKADTPSDQVSIRTGRLQAAPVGIASQHWVDSLRVTVGVANVVDRRGFRRAYALDVGSPTDAVAMGALGDAWLGLHATTPLKGSLEVTADDAVTELVTGRPIPVGELGLYAGELVHIANLVDPDTGAQGRNGRLAGVSPSGDGVTLTIDNQRTAFDALLARMGVVATPRVK